MAQAESAGSQAEPGGTDALVARALEFAASGATPATPRLAATVLLLRPAPADAAHGLEVYLLRRRTSMAFASGMYAFPGGAVDPTDYDSTDHRRADDSGGGWSALLGLAPTDAGAVVRAAVRECAEETGVDVTPSALRPWSRWITPEFEPRRYDTSFFVTALPDRQRADDISGEADRTLWLPPAEALARHRAGDLHMLPPTSVTLGELAAHETVTDVLTAADDRDAAAPVLPRVARDEDGTPRLVYSRDTDLSSDDAP